MRGQRPFGVLVLSILEAIAAVFTFLGAAAFSALHLPGIGSIIGIIAGFGSLLLLLIGLALLFSAYGLWSGERWGWWLSMVVAGFLILTIVFLDIPGCIIGILIGYYLTRKGVKKWFGL